MRALAAVLASSLLFSLVACGQPSSEISSENAASAVITAPAATLTDKVKAAYEESVTKQRPEWLPGEKPISRDELPGTAKTDFDNDAETSEGYGYGYPEARVATVDGQTVYAISGIVSDTGDILGFYDANGDELCEAYSGQGEQPNAGGVDWWK